MTPPVLNEREFELINIIGAELASNQRDLSRRLDLSLGMTNMLVRRLITKGYIRISQLNKKKVQYLLTPKGFAEKMHKSVRYTVNTINSFGLIKNNVKKVLAELFASGDRDFVLVGQSDLIVLIEMAVKELAAQDIRLFHLETISSDQYKDAVALICTETWQENGIVFKKTINLIEELAKLDLMRKE